MDISTNKSFCVLAWTHIATAPNGDIKPCCVSTATINKPDGTPYNLGFDDLSEIINSDSYQKLRQDMLDGKPVTGCDQCYLKEAQQGISHRSDYNNIWINSQHVTDKLKFGTVIPETVEYFDLRFGNLCNLKCKSCSSINSSQFEKELLEIKKDNSSIEKFINVVSYPNIQDWYDTDTFMKNLADQASNIRLLYITGGEPTIIDKNYELLEYFISNGHSKNIVIKLNTNMTNIQDRFIDILHHFKYTILFVSIDGYGPIQEYIRYPSNWDQIDKNLQKLVKKAGSNIFIRATPVIQSTNLGYLTDLFEYFEKFNRVSNKKIIEISPIILCYPSQLNLEFLPISYKKRCWEKIDNWISNECKFQPAEFFSKMKELHHLCNTEVPYEFQLNKFKEFNQIFDNHRGVSLKDVNPELYDIVYKYGYYVDTINIT